MNKTMVSCMSMVVLLGVVTFAPVMTATTPSPESRIIGEWVYRESGKDYETKMTIVFEKDGKALLTSEYTNYDDEIYRENVKESVWKFEKERFLFMYETNESWEDGYEYEFNDDYTTFVVKTDSKDMVWKKTVPSQEDTGIITQIKNIGTPKIIGIGIGVVALILIAWSFRSRAQTK